MSIVSIIVKGKEVFIFASYVALFIGLAIVQGACATSQASQDPGYTQALQAQVDDLNRELMLLHGTADIGEKKQIMQDYWAMLQKQLQYVRHIPGVETHGCRDWSMLDPAVIGHGPVGSSAPCPLMSHDMGPVVTWTIPGNVTPQLFELMMRQQLGTLRAQTGSIVLETDETRRLNLVRALYETRYQDIQTVQGRGWMWTPHDAASLPDNTSMGAELLGHYCSQCHMTPIPTLHTQAEWRRITHYMRDIIRAESGKQITGIQMPTPEEFDMISSYLEMHAEPIP